MTDELRAALDPVADALDAVGVAYRIGEDILGVLKLQRDVIDRAYLTCWAREIGVSDPLVRALDEATPR